MNKPPTNAVNRVDRILLPSLLDPSVAIDPQRDSGLKPLAIRGINRGHAPGRTWAVHMYLTYPPLIPGLCT